MHSDFSSVIEGPYGSVIGSTCTMSSGLMDWEKIFKRKIYVNTVYEGGFHFIYVQDCLKRLHEPFSNTLPVVVENTRTSYSSVS